MTSKLPPLVFLTHSSDYITQGKHKYTLFFRIEEFGGAYYIKSNITDYDSEEFEVVEYIAWTADDAMRYVGKCCSIFGGFEPKILQFRDKYTEREVQEALIKWL